MKEKLPRSIGAMITSVVALVLVVVWVLSGSDGNSPLLPIMIILFLSLSFWTYEEPKKGGRK